MDILKSKKFWVALVTAIVTGLGDRIGLAPESTADIVKVAIAYLVAQVVADHGKSAQIEKMK